VVHLGQAVQAQAAQGPQDGACRPPTGVPVAQ